MSFAKVYSAQTFGLSAKIITIEVDISKGLHAFTTVGLPDKAVEESRDRVGAALKNCGFESPKHSNEKVVISLSPADLKKEGPLFDVGTALAYLSAKELIRFDPEKKIFIGELSLAGDIRPVKGALLLVQEAKHRGFTEAYVPEENVKEAALVEGISIYGASRLDELIDHINEMPNRRIQNKEKNKINPSPLTELSFQKTKKFIADMEDIKGQESAKRGLEIAAAGGHNILMWGPPGTGKTMLARAFAGILPPLLREQVLEVTGIHSLGGYLAGDVMTEIPFRSPHHTASYVSMIGGGTFPRPGEVTLAHRGVLFLDEFPEFEKRVLEALREPLEERVVSVTRARGSVQFPTHFILVAAMNPCPCGMHGTTPKNGSKMCTCSAHEISRYQKKVSGPILDRIDLSIYVGPVSYENLGADVKGENSEIIGRRVREARIFAKERSQKNGGSEIENASIGSRDIEKTTLLSLDAEKTLRQGAEKLGLSARAYHRCIKLARTIADLEKCIEIKPAHVLEALQYRPKFA